MNQLNSKLLLDKSLQQADKAASWLKRSLEKSKAIKITPKLSEADFDVLENLTSRFARLCDILVQKVFRAISAHELEPDGSLIDHINRAAKRGIVTDEKVMRELKELRNTIAHEYTEEELSELFEKIRASSPELLQILENAKKYVKA